MFEKCSSDYYKENVRSDVDFFFCLCFSIFSCFHILILIHKKNENQAWLCFVLGCLIFTLWASYMRWFKLTHHLMGYFLWDTFSIDLNHFLSLGGSDFFQLLVICFIAVILSNQKKYFKNVFLYFQVVYIDYVVPVTLNF